MHVAMLLTICSCMGGLLSLTFIKMLQIEMMDSGKLEQFAGEGRGAAQGIMNVFGNFGCVTNPRGR